ncbi:MAG TPA: dynamin family protein [Blastocatellia bacterium]|nr:dynamin family protein [Blastocatellia bacterium]
MLKPRLYPVLFFGNVSQGKSDLMNAMIGRDIFLPSKNTQITGTLICIEKKPEAKDETAQVEYRSLKNLQETIDGLCKIVEMEPFIINDADQRQVSAELIEAKRKGQEPERGKRESVEILKCIAEYIEAYGRKSSQIESGRLQQDLLHLSEARVGQYMQEDSYGDEAKESRLVKAIRINIKDTGSQSSASELFSKGRMRFIDVPGWGPSLTLHQAAASEELANEDVIIVLVADQSNDAESNEIADWIIAARLPQKAEGDRKSGAGEVFQVINGAENSDTNTTAENQTRELASAHPALAHRQHYNVRDGSPYFKFLTTHSQYEPRRQRAAGAKPTAGLSVKGSAAVGIAESSGGNGIGNSIATLEAKKLSDCLADFIKNERIERQLSAARTKLKSMMLELRGCYEGKMDEAGLQKPYDVHLDLRHQQQHETLLNQECDRLLQAFEAALKEFSKSTSQEDFRDFLSPVLELVHNTVLGVVKRKLATLIYSYEHSPQTAVMDFVGNRDIRDLPVNIILFEVEAAIREAVFRSAPEIAKFTTDELKSVLAKHKILESLRLATFNQTYDFCLPDNPLHLVPLEEVFENIIARLEANFLQACKHVTLYEVLHQPYLISGNAPEEELSRIRDELNNESNVEAASARIEEIFSNIIGSLFNNSELLDGLRRLFWLYAARAKAEFRDYLVIPLLKKHDRALQDKSGPLHQEMKSRFASLDQLNQDYEKLLKVCGLLEELSGYSAAAYDRPLT